MEPKDNRPETVKRRSNRSKPLPGWSFILRLNNLSASIGAPALASGRSRFSCCSASPMADTGANSVRGYGT